MRSIISLVWEYNDPESGVVAQYVSVTSDHNDDVEIPPTKVGKKICDVSLVKNYELLN